MITNRQLFLQHVGQTSDFPMAIEIEKAKGIYLYGPNGKRYIDMISGIGVSALGHCHPQVVKAVQQQAETYMHVMVYGEFVQAPQAHLAKAITDTLPEWLDNVFFVNSGSEAIEGAMKLAKRFTGRGEIISCHKAYHGSTQGALSIGGGEHFRQNFTPLLPGISRIEFGNINHIGLITRKTAAVVIETIQGEAGIRTASAEYWQTLRSKCNKTGTLLIMDEIQSGFGRTGAFWAFEHYGIVPDILVCAKGMGGGMPIGAFISSQEIMSVLKNNPILGHITTFGGHPVSCAASLATIKVIEGERLVYSVEEKAQLIKSLLSHPKIQEIRYKGLMMAVQFDSFKRAKQIVDQCTELGLITDWFLYCDDSIRLAPPLVISENEIKEACSIINKAISIVYEK